MERRPYTLGLLCLTLLGCPLADRDAEPLPTPLPPEPPPQVLGLLENPQYLQSTFGRLRRLEKTGEGRVALLQLGASHTASMAFADEVQNRLGMRFEPLGPGYIPAAPMRATFIGAPPVPDSERGRVKVKRSGPWEIENALHAPAGQLWGLAGSRIRGRNGAELGMSFSEFASPGGGSSGGDGGLVAATAPTTSAAGPAADAGSSAAAGTPSASGGVPRTDGGHLEALESGRATTSVEEAPGRLDLFFADEPGMAKLKLRIDGVERPLPRPPKSPMSGGVQVARYELERAPGTVELSVHGPGTATVLGFAYERTGGGVVYDVLGLSGSSVFVTDRYQKSGFIRQLKAREPTLYILFFGTNESTFPALTAESYQRRYTALLKTLRQAAPGSECLLLSNTDRDVPAGGGWVEAPRADTVERSIREVARANRCAYWSTRRAMGGEGGIREWLEQDPPLALPDRTHLTELGYRTLAKLLVADLYEAYQRSLIPEPR